MLKLLVKKQLLETFRNYFYNSKTNKKRSFLSICFMLVLFMYVLVVLSSLFYMMADTLCMTLVSFNLDWLYFGIFSLITLFLGVFGSIFTVNNTIYHAKDNDLLLSLPIQIKDIVLSRLISIYMLGLLFNSCVLIPVTVVYFKCSIFTFNKFIGIVSMHIILSILSLLISLILGYMINKVTSKFKYKNLATIISSIIGIGAYYMIVYRMNSILNNLLNNALIYGNNIKGKFYPLYFFMQIPTGNLLAITICSLIIFALLTYTIYMLCKSFNEVTFSKTITYKVSKEVKYTKNSAFKALLNKEITRFIGNANYVLNCGLGTLILIIGGIVVLVKGEEYLNLFSMIFNNYPVVILVLLMVAAPSSMNDMVAPSISLEGKNIYILQSLPIATKTILYTKIAMQLIFTLLPAYFAYLCGSIAFKLPIFDFIIGFILLSEFIILNALIGLIAGLCMPVLNWNNEIIPIKQSMAVLLSMFMGLVIMISMIILYIFVFHTVNIMTYLYALIILFALLIYISHYFIVTKGVELFKNL